MTLFLFTFTLLNGIKCNLESFSCKISLLKPREIYTIEKQHILNTISLLDGSKILEKNELNSICRCYTNIWECNFILPMFLLQKMQGLTMCSIGFLEGPRSLFIFTFLRSLLIPKTLLPVWNAGKNKVINLLLSSL